VRRDLDLGEVDIDIFNNRWQISLKKSGRDRWARATIRFWNDWGETMIAGATAWLLAAG
jgi:hypothetical protein